MAVMLKGGISSVATRRSTKSLSWFFLRTYCVLGFSRASSTFSSAFVHNHNNNNSNNNSNDLFLTKRTMSSSTQNPSEDIKTSVNSHHHNHGLLAPVQEKLVNSWPRMLAQETPENLQRSREREGLPDHDTNQTKRPVFNGHYVLVEPSGLNNPRLVLYSKQVATELLKLSPEQIDSTEFLEWVSGNRVLGETYASPYALSIMGTRYTNNCPYGTGDGYGDGRAISIGEFQGQELQLKGAGRTPFHRGADGRAVLRSSIREYLASEAMYHLGVETTRALSLVVSDTDTVQRPWYSDTARLRLPSLDDPRLAQYTPEQRQQILQQLRNEKADPNILVQEKTAITCRVAPSFLRIGHIDLFARRVEQQATTMNDGKYDTTTLQWKELQDIIWHACFREYKETAYDPFFESRDLPAAATVLLNEVADKLAIMVANWIRVGFAQGNFNADNCLVGGRTMDYGPFGFMEEYSPLFAKWTGSGSHFGFMNQPNAAFANYNILVASVVPVICADPNKEDQGDFETVSNTFLERAAKLFEARVDEVFRVKLGFDLEADAGDGVWEVLEPLMRRSRVDWTIFFRQLTYVMKEFSDMESEDYAGMLAVVEGDERSREGSGAFYEPLHDELRASWMDWIKLWRTTLHLSGVTADKAFQQMMKSNPKYILREWMLVDAYSDAATDQEAELFRLADLIQNPYSEGTTSETNRYYRRAPEEALTKGGTGFMS